MPCTVTKAPGTWYCSPPYLYGTCPEWYLWYITVLQVPSWDGSYQGGMRAIGYFYSNILDCIFFWESTIHDTENTYIEK